MKEDSNLESVPTGVHDDNVYSDFSVGDDQRGWGRGGGGRGGNGPRPNTTVDPAANYILGLFKRLGIAKKCDARMIKFEQFMSSSDLVSLDDRHIEFIFAVNRRGERHSKTYISGTGDNNLKLALFSMNLLENTGRSCDTTSV